MPYFLSNNNLIQGQETEVSGEEARHILLSHRVKVGEKLKLQGPDGKRFLSEVVNVKKLALTAKPEQEIIVPAEPKVFSTLFQSIISEKALDNIFQKSTELGLSKIVLFNSANTATKLSAEVFKKKQDRWGKILTEAAKQSERAKTPALEFVKDLNTAVESMKVAGKLYLADVGGQRVSVSEPSVNSFALVVGPEGGFNELEVEQIKSLPNTAAMSMGSILLRADTAAISGLAILQNIYRD